MDSVLGTKIICNIELVENDDAHDSFDFRQDFDKPKALRSP